MMWDDRCQQRRRTSIAAHIVLEESSAMIACIVRDLTPGGACLELTPPAQLPRRFGLVIDPGSEMRQCDLVWRHENRVGVEFIPAQRDLAPAAQVSGDPN
jgi:PilZ domain-containing protein